MKRKRKRPTRVTQVLPDGYSEIQPGVFAAKIEGGWHVVTSPKLAYFPGTDPIYDDGPVIIDLTIAKPLTDTAPT